MLYIHSVATFKTLLSLQRNCSFSLTVCIMLCSLYMFTMLQNSYMLTTHTNKSCCAHNSNFCRVVWRLLKTYATIISISLDCMKVIISKLIFYQIKVHWNCHSYSFKCIWFGYIWWESQYLSCVCVYCIGKHAHTHMHSDDISPNTGILEISQHTQHLWVCVCVWPQLCAFLLTHAIQYCRDLTNCIGSNEKKFWMRIKTKMNWTVCSFRCICECVSVCVCVCIVGTEEHWMQWFLSSNEAMIWNTFEIRKDIVYVLLAKNSAILQKDTKYREYDPWLLLQHISWFIYTYIQRKCR